MSDDPRVVGLADKATEAFFAELFNHVPAGTTGDFSPEASAAFEQAARDVVATILRNATPKRYVIAYEVDWIPNGVADEDPPLDRDHSLEWDHITDYRIVGIGSAAEVERALHDLRAQEALERAEGSPVHDR